MQILSMQYYPGRNIYSHKPVMRTTIDLGEYGKNPTKDIDGFNDRLVELFPGLKKHLCSLGYEGGLVERLKEGTYIGHVTEHLILELESMMGYEVGYGKTRAINEPELYYIVYECWNQRCGVECGKAAVNIMSALVEKRDINITEILENIQRITIESELGPSTKAIYDEAKKRGMPVSRIGNEGIIQIGYGKYSRLIEASLSDAPSCIAVDIAGNKHLTKQILSNNNIPVPRGGDIAYTEESAVFSAEDIGYPVVLKPYDANQGKGVALELGNAEQVRQAYREAVKYSKAVIVERYVKGKDYRVLVVGGKVAAVAERRPPFVKGDGMHNIKELIDMENQDPLRGGDHERPLTTIKLDNIVKQVLGRKGMDEESIPGPGEIVKLRDNGNLSTGGTARDCTDIIHPYNSNLAIKAVKAIGLDIAGVDITADDISVPLTKSNGAFIEINAAPGLRMHLYPTEGKPRNVATDIIDMMFPESRPYSVPIAAITGTNGKTTTTRLVRHTLSLTGKKVGMTSTSGVFVDDECILKGDNTGPLSARLILSNKEVEAAVLETARGGIVRRGLGYDLADVGVIVNITEDHLGLDGINTLEELAGVKSLVIEAVKPDGYAVLNADDDMIQFLLSRVRSNVILFSRSIRNPIVLRHVENGGRAVITDEDSIYVYDGMKKIHVLELEKIPITFGGIVECNIENSLAAISTLYSLGIPLNIIQMGLKTFKPDVVTNPGRFNMFNVGDFKVMLDYGHNPAGYNAVIKFIKHMNATRLVGIIGVPGDRLDKNISEVGESCGKVFNQIYIKEDNDLRGRKPGEVADLLYNSVLKGGLKKENIKVIHPELKALETAMLDGQPGDLIVMLYEEFEAAVELITRFSQELEHGTLEPIILAEESVG